MHKFAWQGYAAARKVVDIAGMKRLRLGDTTPVERVGQFIRWAIWRTFGPHRNAPVKVRLGYRMYMVNDTVDAHPPFPDMVLGQYDEEVAGWLLGFLRPGMKVLDIGAHFGYFTLLAAKEVGPTGKIWAFEPAPENFRVLVRNIELNRYTNVVAVPKAVSNRSRPIPFFISGEGSGLHSLQVNSRARREVRVEATTLDEFLEGEGWPHVDLVKMDIQGAEKAALDGASRFLTWNRPLTLILEFWPDGLRAAGVDPEELLFGLASLGFTFQLAWSGPEPVDVRSILNALGPGNSVNLRCAANGK